MQPGHRIEAGRCFGESPLAPRRKPGSEASVAGGGGVGESRSRACSSRWRLGIYDLRGQTLSRG